MHPDWPEPIARVQPVFGDVRGELGEWFDVSDILHFLVDAAEHAFNRDAGALWECDAFEAFITIWGLARGDSQDDDFNSLGWNPSQRKRHFDTSFGSMERFIIGRCSGLLNHAVLLLTNESRARLVYESLLDGKTVIRDCFTSAREAELAVVSAYGFLKGISDYSQMTATPRMKRADADRKFPIGHLADS